MSNVGRGIARRVLIGASLYFLGFAFCEPVQVVVGDDASATPRIIRVEEDWVLEVAVPDAGSNAPQVTCVFAPTADVDFGYAEFAVNHHSQPAYRAGGLQLLVWSGGQPIVVNNDPDGGVLSQNNERITWTQQLSIGDDGVLTFAVNNGRSTTWNNFGDDGRLAVRTVGQITNLNDYRTDVSVKNSGIGFASNRVGVLKIVAVRYFADDGRTFVDESPHVVFEHE
jgi:hypothetical protein